jgi:hypothetical protein
MGDGTLCNGQTYIGCRRYDSILDHWSPTKCDVICTVYIMDPPPGMTESTVYLEIHDAALLN